MVWEFEFVREEMNPETDPGGVSPWTLVSTGASSKLSDILLSLTPEAGEKYLPYKAVRVNHDFSKVLNGRFWRNLGITERTREKEREARRKLREVS